MFKERVQAQTERYKTRYCKGLFILRYMAAMRNFRIAMAGKVDGWVVFGRGWDDGLCAALKELSCELDPL